MNPYIGHESQIRGVEEHRLVGGKGDSMRLYEINNGKGLMLTVTPDRNGDIMRLRYKGINLGYMSPCGYVAPTYYDKSGDEWLRSFTAGFLTTCGLENVGVVNEDEGEVLPLHGTLANLRMHLRFLCRVEDDGCQRLRSWFGMWQLLSGW